MSFNIHGVGYVSWSYEIGLTAHVCQVLLTWIINTLADSSESITLPSFSLKLEEGSVGSRFRLGNSVIGNECII